MKALKGKFDFILNTVAAAHDINKFLDLLTLEGKMILVGIPPEESAYSAAKLISKEEALLVQ